MGDDLAGERRRGGLILARGAGTCGNGVGGRARPQPRPNRSRHACGARVSPRPRLCQTPRVSQNNPVRIFVTHAWENSDDYLRVFEYLESQRTFFYRNYSTPDRRPPPDKEARHESLRQQITPAEAVIALSSLYEAHQGLLTFQLLYAHARHTPVILMKAFGTRQEVPKTILDLADEVVEWDERALVDAIRRQARHEETTRWDTIEFKLD